MYFYTLFFKLILYYFTLTRNLVKLSLYTFSKAYFKLTTHLKKTFQAREQLDDARNNFETINKELHEELPTLYDG